MSGPPELDPAPGRTHATADSREAVERFVVGGWVDAPASLLASRLVLLGELTEADLRYVGYVRLGRRDDAASRLGRGLEGVEVDLCPFVHPPEVSGAHWCREGLWATVRFDGRNAIGRLRMPSLETSSVRGSDHALDLGPPSRHRTTRG